MKEEISKEMMAHLSDMADALGDVAKAHMKKFREVGMSPSDAVSNVLNAFSVASVTSIITFEEMVNKDGIFLESAKKSMDFWHERLKQPKPGTEASKEPSSETSQ